MATNADRAALERRLAEQVEGWRVKCSGQHLYLEPLAELLTMPERHWVCADVGCPGWLPGVAEADGTTRRIHLEDLLVYADNINDDRLLEFWHQLWNVNFSQPDALLIASMRALANFMEAQHGI